MTHTHTVAAVNPRFSLIPAFAPLEAPPALAPSLGLRAGGFSLPLSGGACLGASPSGPGWNARKTSHGKRLPSAALSDAVKAEAPTVTALPLAAELPAIDTQGRAA